MAKNTTLGHLTIWSINVVTIAGHLTHTANSKYLATWPTALITVRDHLTHMAKVADHCNWPPASATSVNIT